MKARISDAALKLAGAMLVLSYVAFLLASTYQVLRPPTWGTAETEVVFVALGSILSGVGLILVALGLRNDQEQLNYQRRHAEAVFIESTVTVTIERPEAMEEPIYMYRLRVINTGGTALRVIPRMRHARSVHPKASGPSAQIAHHLLPRVESGEELSSLLDFYGHRAEKENDSLTLYSYKDVGHLLISYVNYLGEPQRRWFLLDGGYLPGSGTVMSLVPVAEPVPE